MLTQAKQQFVKFMQGAVNRYLALDPLSLTRLQTLHNKVVKIVLTGLPLEIYLMLTATGLEFDLVNDTNRDRHVDTVITGTPLRLLHMTLSRENRQAFFADDVSIEGNLELGRQVTHLFDQIDIDWEEHVSSVIGDVPAYQLARTARKIRSLGKETLARLKQNVNEYVHEEINLFPASEALRDFFQDVDDLRMEVDRLEVKLKHLHKTVPATRGDQ
jgi:ubiquinone biosynthesis protein UbiJ